MTAQSAGLVERLLAAADSYDGRGVNVGEMMREAAAAIAALAAPAADGWRPIAEAPKDSEVVLLCDTHGNRWSDCFPGVPANGCGYPAILWQPLPAAPQAQGEGAAMRPDQMSRPWPPEECADRTPGNAPIVERMEMTRVKHCIGAGVQGDPFREIADFYYADGTFAVRIDPYAEQQP